MSDNHATLIRAMQHVRFTPLVFSFLLLLFLLSPAAAEPQSPEGKCELLWEDDFPLLAAEQAYGPGVKQGFKVELCHFHWGKRVVVWERLFREYAGTRTMEQRDIRSWFIVTGYAIFPFERQPSPWTVPLPAPAGPGGY